MASGRVTKFVPRGKFHNRFYNRLEPHIIDFATLEKHSFRPLKPFVELKPSICEKRTCARCGVNYTVDDSGMPEKLNQNNLCSYHPGKKLNLYNINCGELSYGCCKTLVRDFLAGCKQHHYHISEHPNYNMQIGFLSTDGTQGYNPVVLSLDCEMCITSIGLECTRVTVVDQWSRTIFESLVRPDAAILDYVTEFSGITEEMMLKGPTKTLPEVQKELLSIIKKDTILIGHGIDCDLKVLKLQHNKIVDTSVVFPHYRPDLKNSLRHLAWIYLGRKIRMNGNGHDSAEDATACMDLMLKKLDMMGDNPEFLASHVLSPTAREFYPNNAQIR